LNDTMSAYHLASDLSRGETWSDKCQDQKISAANANWKSVLGYGLMLTNQPGEGSWPITAASFILMHIVPQDAASSAAALKFFDRAYKNGGKMAEELDYIPMPDNVVELVHAEWAKIKDSGGKPLFPM
jgi:phosphate transport system substrate-binding protein